MFMNTWISMLQLTGAAGPITNKLWRIIFLTELLGLIDQGNAIDRVKDTQEGFPFRQKLDTLLLMLEQLIMKML